MFDGSATYCDISLNKVPLTGPDLVNSLLGVLVCFRKEPIAIMADVEQMVHCFDDNVCEDHREFLQFLWFENNDRKVDISEFHTKVHLFGNSPSPASAADGRCKFALNCEEKYRFNARHNVERIFYLDDSWISLPTPVEAKDLTST